MDEALIRRQQRKNTLYNLAAFAVLFSLFGAIVFAQVRSSLYGKLDADLSAAAADFSEGNGVRGTAPGPGRPNAPDLRSPRVIPILRDSGGAVLDYGSVNASYYELYLRDLPFDPDSVGKIVAENAGGYYFRSLTVKTQQAGQGAYLQLVVNADSEHSLLSRMSFIIGVSAALFTLLSILASSLLSRRTMRPVRKAWNRQAEFVENVSHELRTPLTVIQNAVESLLTRPEGRVVDESETLAGVLDETARLSRLVADILTLARSDGAMTELSKELFSLDRLVQSVCEPYRELAEQQGKTFSFRAGCPGNLSADRDRIHQLLVILLDNALKYTDPGDAVEVSTAAGNGRAVLRVADTGIGVEEGSLEKIFDRFYRGGGARARGGGSGLGLSIALWIVKKHGGTIRAERNTPRGTVFTVILPV